MPPRERRNRFGVAEVVLREGASVAMDQARHGRPGDAEDAFYLTAYDFRNLVFRSCRTTQVGGAAGEAGETGHVFGRALREKGGIPNRAQHAQSFAARHQESEPISCEANLIGGDTLRPRQSGVRNSMRTNGSREFVRNALQNL